MHFHTLIDIFEHRVNVSASKTALVARQYDQWQHHTWRQWWQDAECLAAGLLELGVEMQDRVALLSKTRLEWVLADMGVMMAGGVVVPIYPSHLPEHRVRLLTLAQCKVLIVESPEQLAAMLPLMSLSDVRAVVVIETSVSVESSDTGLTSTLTLDGVLREHMSWQGRCMSLADLKNRGRQHKLTHMNEVIERRRGVSAVSLASIVYTSGTTDDPKGVLLTHGHFVAQVNALKFADVIRADDANLLILPLAHVFARVVVYAAMHYGARTIFAEHLSTMVRDARETRPTLIAGVPHIFEKIARGLKSHLEHLHPLKVKMMALFSDRQRKDRRRAGLRERVPEKAVEILLHARLKSLFGGQLRVLISGGAALDEDVARFFFACGMGIVEGYGLTETTAALTINSAQTYRFGSVGKALPNVDLTIGYDGEILARGASVASEVLSGEGTRSLLDEKGWFHTGDLGRFDVDGYLWITGRKKSLLVTSGGKNVCPDPLERRLSSLPMIDHVLVSGDGRPYLVALLTLDTEALMVWARQHQLGHLSPGQLATHPEVLAHLDEHVSTVNALSPKFELVRKICVVAEPMTVENGLLTPTLKVKRQEVERLYHTQLDALYGARV